MPLTTLNDNIQPFSLGTVRSVATTQGKDLNTVTWMPQLSSAGMYAVYVSYATLPHAVSDAHYMSTNKWEAERGYIWVRSILKQEKIERIAWC